MADDLTDKHEFWLFLIVVLLGHQDVTLLEVIVTEHHRAGLQCNDLLQPAELFGEVELFEEFRMFRHLFIAEFLLTGDLPSLHRVP